MRRLTRNGAVDDDGAPAGRDGGLAGLQASGEVKGQRGFKPEANVDRERLAASRRPGKGGVGTRDRYPNIRARGSMACATASSAAPSSTPVST